MSGAAGGGTWEANRRARSSEPRAPSRISPMRAAERAASATFPCRFVLLPFSVLSVDLFLCARLGWFGGTEKPNRRNRHRTRRFLILWQTDRLLICGNRSLQQPNKPNRFVGLNRMPTPTRIRLRRVARGGKSDRIEGGKNIEKDEREIGVHLFDPCPCHPFPPTIRCSGQSLTAHGP